MSASKTAYSLFSFPQNASPEKLFPLIAEAGYDGVEPVLSEAGYLNPGMTDDEILNLRSLAEANGLSIPSVGVWSLWENNLVSDNPDIRKNAADIVRFQLRAARLLGAGTTLVVPGYVGTEFASKPEKIRYDIAYDRIRDTLSELAMDAEKEGVVIGIENVWNRFLLSPLETKRLFDEVNSPYVGMYFDVGNIIYIGYPEQWIEILGKRIVCVHLSDCRYGAAGLSAFVDLFAGDVDFEAVSASLAGVGYDGWLVLEMLPNYKQYPEASIISNRPAVEKIAAMIGAGFTR